MKILLLTCSNGEGHNSAAIAIYDEAIRNGDEAEIVFSNFLGEGKKYSRFDRLHNSIITYTPGFFGFIYNLGLICNKAIVKNAIYLKNRTKTKELYKYIIDNKFDAVVCTHPFMMAKMTAVRKKHKLNIPTFAVLTDYTYIPFTNNSKLDKYFIAHKDLSLHLDKWKIPVEKQVVTGIPTKLEYAENISKEDARDKLNLPQDKKIILVVGGAVGCKNIYGMCKHFKKLKDDNTIVYVVTGHNKKMFKNINKKYSKCNIIPVEYTTVLFDWIKACDVVITKPGGLSSTEFAVANKPIVHLKAKWGCEKQNAKFFLDKKMSKFAKNNLKAVQISIELLNDTETCNELITNQKANINPNSAKDILKEVAKYV